MHRNTGCRLEIAVFILTLIHVHISFIRPQAVCRLGSGLDKRRCILIAGRRAGHSETDLRVLHCQTKLAQNVVEVVVGVLRY